MIKRLIADKVLEYATKFPVVTITGPRQSGKTTLAKMLFKEKPYVSLEDLDIKREAIRDPRGFLKQFPKGAILDEIQKAPEIFSYIQTIVDEKNEEGLFVLTGSQQFEMLSHLSQSLAGRTALVKLLPFTLQEAYPNIANLSIEEVLYTGFMPRIFDKKINPTDMAAFYINTYLERDVRQLLNIKDLTKFENFLKLCASRTGNLINLSSFSNDCDVNHNTIKSWLSVLEASYIIKLQKPYFRNINKRLIKSPKLYFLDVGLASYLLGIKNKEHLATHPLKGSLFETFIVSEILKNKFNQGRQDNLFFYGDHKGTEIDVVLDNGYNLGLIEIKSGQTVHSDFFKGLNAFPKIKDYSYKKNLIYGGDRPSVYNYINIHSWRNIPDFEELE